jgi:glycosyltransferase involved in cell wall biosynthesis
MLAIIIPYYKISFLEEALQSLVNQTNKRFKVYIGDDASPENPSAIIGKFQEKLELVYHRFDSNLGGESLVRQWDSCIALSATEEWLMILGDDDCIGPNCIADFYENHPEIVANKCNVVRFATIEIDENSNPITKEYKHPKFEKATDSFYRKIRNKTRSSLSEYIFKRKAYDKYGFYNYDLAWYADDRAWLEFSDSNAIYSINSSKVNFRLSTENISRVAYKENEKKQSKCQFFDFIIYNLLCKFSREQKKHLLLYYEQMIYRFNKVTFYFWISMSWMFFKNLYFIQSIKFTRRVLIHLNKNNADA